MKQTFVLVASFCLVWAQETPWQPPEGYLGPETVVNITPEEARSDPGIIKINTAGEEPVVYACIRRLHEALRSLP